VQLLLQSLEVCLPDRTYRLLARKIVRWWLIANADRTKLRNPVTQDGGDLMAEEWAVVAVSDELRSFGVWPIGGPFPAISVSGPYDQFLKAGDLLVVELPLPQGIAALQTALDSFSGCEDEAAGYLLGWMVKCDFTIHQSY